MAALNKVDVAEDSLSHQREVTEKSNAGSQSGEDTEQRMPTRSRFLDGIPPWISSNLRSPRSLKVWARCWLATWICYILILPNKSLQVMGNAAFFALLSSIMLPANLPVQLFLWVLTSVILGMLLGWGFGAAAMRAALASRDQLVLKQSLLREAQSVAGLANPDALFKADIFSGRFLDTRSSVVFGCFLGLATFLFALIRAYAPKLVMTSVFATIAIDIFCSYGPLFPFAQYTILNSLLTSVAFYIGIAVVLIVLVFPESLNHASLVSTSALLTKLMGLVEMQQQVLNASPNDLAPGSLLIAQVDGAKSGVIAHLGQLTATAKFLNLEFSWGKWNGDDVKALHGPLLGVVSRAAALHSFARLVGHVESRTPDQLAESLASSNTSVDGSASAGDTYLLRQLRERNTVAESEHSVRLSDILPAVQDATADLRQGCSMGLNAVQAVIDSVNTNRYSRAGAADSQERVLELEKSIERLRLTLQDFKDSKRLQLIEPFQDIVQSADSRKNQFAAPLRSLFISYVFAVNLIVLTETILRLMEVVKDIANKRTRNRIWAPRGLRAIGKAIISRGDVSDQALGEDTAAEREDEEHKEKRSYKLDPDSMPPVTFFQRIANGIHVLYTWSKTPEAVFAFKYVIVTIALWLPSVFKSSAHFVYAQKGLWALIMAQTTLNIFAADQIFNYVLRLSGTFIGAVLGLLCWYIGSAKSTGSPYGSAAAVGVFLVPIIFLRLYTPSQYLPGVILGGATWCLVVGYSWLDGHLPTFGNPGIGWPIAWRRCVTVLIGSAASFIIMMLPPKSGRKAVRHRNASNISEISSIYSNLLAAWIDGPKQSNNEKSPPEPSKWMRGFRESILQLAEQLQAVKSQTVIAKWEGNIRGAWPFEEYMKLAAVQSDMVADLALLAISLTHLDYDMRVAFLQNTRVLNPNFVSDVMSTFALVSQALRTGEPMQQAFHRNLIDRLHYHGTLGNRVPAAVHGESAQGQVQFHHLDAITNYEYMFYASAVVAVFQLLEGLNELQRITTRLVGEIPLQGFDRWRDEYERTHVLV